MARIEPDLVGAIRRAGELIGHVQFADNPGRHEPGTGALDFAAAFAALRAVRYDGAAAAEYRPAGRTEDGLGWMAEAPSWFGRPST
jgi:hydroxypyruvate isomerase